MTDHYDTVGCTDSKSGRELHTILKSLTKLQGYDRLESYGYDLIVEG
jgi:hypothetical protein